MKISSVDLAVSAIRPSQYPDDNKPTFLLVGRSNVGKSSFINTLINRKNYARISGKPGKTQTLNFYFINSKIYLVDVPGYGFAGLSKTKRQKFGLMIEEFLANSQTLKKVFLIIDFRHKPSKDDILMYNFLKYHEIPVVVVANKIDKISKNKRDKQKKAILDTIDLAIGDEFIMFSSVTKEGKNEIYEIIESI